MDKLYSMRHGQITIDHLTLLMKNKLTNLSECSAKVIGAHNQTINTCKIYNISDNCTPQSQLSGITVASLYTKYDARPILQKINIHSGGKTQCGGVHVGRARD